MSGIDSKSSLLPGPSSRLAGSRTGDPRPRAPVAGTGGASSSSVQAAHSRREHAGIRPWNPVRELPERLRESLSKSELERLERKIATLQNEVASAKLDYVPVFGYLSLLVNNYHELGKRAQDEVVPGRDVVRASLADHAVDVVASTVFRGTPEHPGVVAGLRNMPGESVPGVVLKLPTERAEELLARVLARELFAESDLASENSSMYVPEVGDVTLENGERVKALFFVTNPSSPKALTERQFDYFGSDGLTASRLAYFMAARGGVEISDKNGKTRVMGGPCVDYWTDGYLRIRRESNYPIDFRIARAVEASKSGPSVAGIAERAGDEANALRDAWLTHFSGAAVPWAFRRGSKPRPTAGESQNRR